MKVNYDDFSHSQVAITDGNIISICSARCCKCHKYFEEANNFPPLIHYKRCPFCGNVLDGDRSESMKGYYFYE